MSDDFQIFCCISIPPKQHLILLPLSPIFPLLPSKIGAVEKKQNIAKKLADNSETASSKKNKYCVKFSDSCCYKFKFIQKPRKGEVLLYVLCRSDFSVAHGGENDINRHKYTSKHKGYVHPAQRKLTNSGASSATAN